MASVRINFSSHPDSGGGSGGGPSDAAGHRAGPRRHGAAARFSSADSRLNLLVSYGGWRQESWADQLPVLLEPLGVRAWRAGSGREAAELIQRISLHIALVDLSLPLGEASANQPVEEGGERILQLLGRLAAPPPTVIVRRRRAAREADRTLMIALSAGAFAVVDAPVQLETILETMRRVLRRHYADRWPEGCRDAAADPQD